MNDNPVNQREMVDTTDGLEAVTVFRNWKNLFFVLALLCLLFTQMAFWTINSGLIKTTGTAEADAGQTGTVAPLAPAPTTVGEADQTDTESSGFLANFFGNLNFEYLVRTIGLVNGILQTTAILFCLTLFCSLMISLAGRLGGVNQISRAFILSMLVLVLVIPWQALGLSIIGVIWTPAELVRWLAARNDSIWNMVVYYLRFTVYWLLVVLLLCLAQARTVGWNRAILRRLEII